MVLNSNGQQMGFASHCGYGSNEDKMHSLAVLDADYLDPGTDVVILWGKAMLALLPFQALQDLYVVQDGHCGVSPAELDRLMTDIHRVRRSDWAIARGELEPGVTAVGTVIRHPSGTTLGAVTISARGQSKLAGPELDRVLRRMKHSRARIESDIDGSTQL
jgi:hypothetical protein